ncbi:hypothetical protein J6590_055193 [Homalodisca vitripennis]|nr:hypothetical protein J6590_055193 [Homalodisca vitripennis]
MSRANLSATEATRDSPRQRAECQCQTGTRTRTSPTILPEIIRVMGVTLDCMSSHGSEPSGERAEQLCSLRPFPACHHTEAWYPVT